MGDLELSNQDYSNISLQGLKGKIKGVNQRAVSVTKDALKSTAEELKKANKNIVQTSKNAKDELVTKGKKVNRKLGELAGKAKAAYKKMLRKSVLSNTYVLIRSNAHGLAQRLSPAIISKEEANKLNFKDSFIPKSKKAYDETLIRWKKLGGTKSKLDDAILKGAKSRFHKFKMNPYVTPVSGFDGQYSSSFLLPFPNSGGYSSIDGDNDGFDDLTGLPIETAESIQGITTDKIDTNDYNELAKSGVEKVDSEDSQSAYKSFMSTLLNLWKNDKDEVPYKADSAQAKAFVQDKVADEPSLPKDTIGSEIIDDINGDKIWGIKKLYFYAGAATAGIIAIWGGAKILKKAFKK